MKAPFENVYDAYCPMLYSIALQACSNHTRAAKVLRLTFKKVYQQKISPLDKKTFCIPLIKMIILTAREELYPGESKYYFKIKQFENTPILHKILIEQVSLENYCIENGISRDKAIQNIREEFMLIRNTYPKSLIDIDINSLHLN